MPDLYPILPEAEQKEVIGMYQVHHAFMDAWNLIDFSKMIMEVEPRSTCGIDIQWQHSAATAFVAVQLLHGSDTTDAHMALSSLEFSLPA